MDRKWMGAALLASLLVAATGGRAMAMAMETIVCPTRFDQALDQARSLRIAGKLDQAMAATQGVLKSDPGNLRARYTLGLIQMDQGDKTQGNAKADLQRQGLAALISVSQAMQVASAKSSAATKACLKEQGLFTVDNTIGSYYLRNGDVRNASLYLNRASSYDKANLLSQDSHAKVSGNLGHLYYFLGDNSRAVTYLQTAKQAGDKSAGIDNTLAAIRATQGMQ